MTDEEEREVVDRKHMEMLDALRGLSSDERVVTMVDFEDETTATLGELASEAVAALESLEDL